MTIKELKKGMTKEDLQVLQQLNQQFNYPQIGSYEDVVHGHRVTVRVFKAQETPEITEFIHVKWRS